MYILLGIAALILVFIAGVVIAASMRSTDISYQRTIMTSASADTAFAIFSDLARWDEWSPYNKKTPT